MRPSYRHLLIALAASGTWAAAPHVGVAQTPGSGNVPGDAYRLSMQFAVPASPAFKLVEVQESAILRPGNFQQLSAALGNFTGGSNSFQLPKEVGIEVAPFFLARGRTLTLPQYAARDGLYRFRVSAAVKRGDGAGGPTDLAVGFRFAPVDGSDPRTNTTIIARVTAINTVINDICVARIARRPPTARSQNDFGGVVNCADPRGDVPRLKKALAALKPTDTAYVRTDSALREAEAVTKEADEQIKQQLDLLEKAWTDTAWNKRALEFAVGAAARTRDSLGTAPWFRTASAWLSAAWPVDVWGQFVGGLNATAGRDSAGASTRVTSTAAAGFYVGGNRYKGFLEAQGSVKESKGGGQATVGAELFLVDGLWAHLRTGWQREPGDAKGRLVTRFTVRTKFPFSRPEPTQPAGLQTQ